MLRLSCYTPLRSFPYRNLGGPQTHYVVGLAGSIWCDCVQARQDRLSGQIARPRPLAAPVGLVRAMPSLNLLTPSWLVHEDPTGSGQWALFRRPVTESPVKLKFMILALVCLAAQGSTMSSWPDSMPVASFPGERHLANVRQLTFGGQNAEAYWSPDGTKLIFQSRQPEYPDEQIFTMNADGSNKRLVSTGLGRCTCSYYFPDMDSILFSSTHERQPGPQQKADMSKGYVWMVNPNFAIYRADPNGGNLSKLIDKGGYVAETTIAPNGKYLVFTGNFEGDLEIYRADLDGSNIKRLTHHPGYDGGPFVSWDSRWVVYRRDTISSKGQLDGYRSLLKENLVRPTKLEIFLMDPDGKHNRQVTHLGAASFAPFMFPDDSKIIFASNYGDPKGREFDLFTVNVDGTHLERITFAPEFDGFPMFTRDGKKLVWASNRGGKAPHETNIFVADWVN